MDESLPATAPPTHSGFSKGNLSLYVIIMIITGTKYVIRAAVSPMSTSHGDETIGKLWLLI